MIKSPSKLNFCLRTRLYRFRRDHRPFRFIWLVWLLILTPVHIARWIVSRLRSPSDFSPHRILVIHLAGLGDMLMMTPALRVLQQQFPAAQIDLLTLHPYVRDAFQNHPRLRRIICLPHYPGHWITERFHSTPSRLFDGAKLLWYYPETVASLISTNYAIGVNFALSDFEETVGNALLFTLGIPCRLGTETRGKRFLTHPSIVDYSKSHRVKAYSQILAPLKADVTELKYEYVVPDLARQNLKHILSTVGLGNDGRPLAVLHPGGKMLVNSRRWPSEYYVQVGRFLALEMFRRIVLVGDKDDQALCESIAAQIGNGAVSLAGQLSFAEMGALLTLCELCVTNDTSTLHLAEAVGSPKVISIFGPTDPDLLAPHNSRHTVFRSDLPCAPCLGAIIHKNSPRCWRVVKEECLWRITPDRIIQVIRESLAIPSIHVHQPCAD